MTFLFLLGWFASCHAGPSVEAHPICIEWFDEDADGDVDMRDLAAILNEVSDAE